MKKLIKEQSAFLKELDAKDWFCLIASTVLLLLVSHIDYITEVAAR